MHRSSQCVATLACALAKAQAELVNPEKSLVATIRGEGRGNAERSFRYASLSSGLDIVRKTLSRHEIAAIQTTGINEATGTVNLTTMLAHASGEWIASDWPVCQVADTASPHRMGAALTYARRYGLFTLVGIAGEDDIDALDFNRAEKLPEKMTGVRDAKPTLEPEQSARVRKQFLDEIVKINSAEEAAQWARRTLPGKNSLTRADAQLVEGAFRSRVATFGDDDEANQEAPSSPPSDHRGTTAITGEIAPTTDKNTLTLPKPRRHRDKDHLKFVSMQACLICGREPSDAHHLRFAQQLAIGPKVSDEFTVPLCRGHHRELHRSGNETKWWHAQNIDPLKTARRLWQRTNLIARDALPHGKNGKTNPQSRHRG